MVGTVAKERRVARAGLCLEEGVAQLGQRRRNMGRGAAVASEMFVGGILGMPHVLREAFPSVLPTRASTASASNSLPSSTSLAAGFSLQLTCSYLALHLLTERGQVGISESSREQGLGLSVHWGPPHLTGDLPRRCGGDCLSPPLLHALCISWCIPQIGS